MSIRKATAKEIRSCTVKFEYERGVYTLSIYEIPEGKEVDAEKFGLENYVCLETCVDGRGVKYLIILNGENANEEVDIDHKAENKQPTTLRSEYCIIHLLNE